MTGEYDVGLARADDAGEISRLSRDAVEHGLPWRWTSLRIARSIADASINVVVAREHGRLLGFAIMKYGDEEAHVLLLAVQPACRRRGVGSALLSWLESTARVAGINLIRLEARAGNEAARSFYRNHGFIEMGVRERYYHGVEDAVRMAKDLWLA